MTNAFAELKAQLAQIKRLREVSSLIGWDQQTYMPSGGAQARGEQAAALGTLIHQMATSPEIGRLLEQAERDTAASDPDADDVRMLKVIRRDFDRATRLPSELVAALARHQAISHSIWVTARRENDFASFAPALEQMLELTRRKAEHYGFTGHIYDALLEGYEPGLTQAEVAAMFNQLKPVLVGLTHSIAERAVPAQALLHGRFPTAAQRQVTLRLAEQFGFDFRRGRQDEAAHPFCSGINRDDVRITTRFQESDFTQGLYATLHETGHGLYEQGLPEAYDGTALGAAASLGVHESQSRMWENMVGRSRAYCGFAFPSLQAAFPEALAGGTAEEYYRAVNTVEPSFIRVEADEVTYNLHVLLRFELECALLTGELEVKDLPRAWNEKMESYLGVTPPDFARGVLQDVHWSEGLIGYFPTYTLGNLISGQLWSAIGRAIPDINDKIGKGEFAPLLEWLRTNVHAHGRKFTPSELVERATGEPLTSQYYLKYLTSKFAELYQLD